MCPLCQNKGIYPYGNYQKCVSCGLLFVADKIPAHKLLRSYTGGFLKSFRRKLFGKFRKFENWGQYDEFMEKAHRVSDTIQKMVADKKDVTILDVGCNKGFLLSACIQKGWNAHGIELVGELLTPFRKKYPGNNVHIGRLEDTCNELNKKYFDVITAIDVVEHFEDPLESIKKIRQLLKPNGIFVIQSPDSQSERSKKEGVSWGALKPMEHLFIFNKNNYAQLMQKAGFKNTKILRPFDEADGNFAAMSTL